MTDQRFVFNFSQATLPWGLYLSADIANKHHIRQIRNRKTATTTKRTIGERS